MARPKTIHPHTNKGAVPESSTPRLSLGKRGLIALSTLRAQWLYALGGFLLWVFCTLIYGDVFQHIASENYVSGNPDTMVYVLRRDAGWLFWIGRWFVLPFQWKWLGGTLLAALLLLAAWLFDSPVRHLRRWWGLGFLPIFSALGWMVWEGYDLFLRTEPSTFVLVALSLLAIALLVALGAKWFRKASSPVLPAFPLGGLLVLVTYTGLSAYALVGQENVRLSCRLQNQMEREEWDNMLETARQAHRPTRTIAALHAIALVHTQQLLDGAWAIPYDFPELKLDYLAGSDESVNYTSECNLHAGLSYPAYHVAMEQLVTLGPRLRTYKLLALCALLNGERALAERYFYTIGQMPGNQAWIDRYRPMLTDRSLLQADPMLANILSMAPMEKRFEQNYRKPAFLGYNVGMMQGSDASLITSVATCMYSKDLDNFLMRAGALRNKMHLPHAALQAIAIASVRREGLRERFPECNDMVMSELRAFIQAASPYLEALNAASTDEAKLSARREMATALREDWLGSYFYYYYCGNMAVPQQEVQSHGVN